MSIQQSCYFLSTPQFSVRRTKGDMINYPSMSIFARFKTIQIARRGLELDILCLGPLFYYEPKHSATGGYFLPLQVFEK